MFERGSETDRDRGHHPPPLPSPPAYLIRTCEGALIINAAVVIGVVVVRAVVGPVWGERERVERQFAWIPEIPETGTYRERYGQRERRRDTHTDTEGGAAGSCYALGWSSMFAATVCCAGGGVSGVVPMVVVDAANVGVH